jgi:hypothetical protein
MSSSESRSTSVTSIVAIRLHFKELYGLLNELGFDVPESNFTGILPALEDGNINRIEFLGINRGGKIELALSMQVDWPKHEIIVKSGNSVRLPIRNGVVYLQQVRAIAEEFMNLFNDRKLSGEFRSFYRAGMSGEECTRMNRKYGFAGSSNSRTWASDADSLAFTSRYHEAVSFGIEVARRTH